MRSYAMCVLCTSCLKRLQLRRYDLKLWPSWTRVLSSQAPPYIQPLRRHISIHMSQRHLGVHSSKEHVGVHPSNGHVGVQSLQRCSYAQSAKTRERELGRDWLDNDLPDGDETSSTVTKALNKNPETWYITDPKLADKLAKLISAELCRDTVVIETNPGPGILTEALVKHKVSNLILTETNEQFMPSLQNLVAQKGSGIIQQFANFDFFPALLSRHGIKLVDLMKIIPQKEWTQDPALAIIGIPSPKKDFIRRLLRHILYSSASRESIWTLGRIDSFIFITPKDRLALLPLSFPPSQACRGLYTRPHVLYQLLFDTKTLAQVQNTDFSPRYPRSMKKSKHVDAVDSNSLYLMHIRPKAGIFQMFNEADDLAGFVTFTRQIFRGKLERIIPKMESLVPGCGIHMINKGFTMMQTMVDVSPEMFVSLYQDMLSWPEYAESSLHAELLETNADVFEDDGPVIEVDIAEEEEEVQEHHMIKRTNGVSKDIT